MSILYSLLLPYRGMPREIYVIFISRIINAVGCFVMPLMTIILTESIGMSAETAGLYISIAGLLFLPAAMFGGKLADSFGRKRVIITFDGLGIALYVTAGLMGATINMVYVMMLAGAAMTAAGPAHDALIADLTTPENRSGAYALSYLGWNIGFAVGPVMGGILYQKHLSWVFIGDAFTALLSLMLIFVFIKETINRTKQPITDKKQVLERHEQGSILSVLLKRPILIYFAVIMFGYNFTYSQWSFMLPMQSIQNFSENGARYFGYVAGFNGLVVMLFTPIVTRFAENIPTLRRMVYGGILYALGFGMLGVFNSLPFIFFWAYIFTIGEIILAISVTPFIVNHTPASHRGRMNAVIPIVFNLGHTLGPLAMGTVLNFISIETGWLFIGASTFVFSFLMWLLEKYEKRSVMYKAAVTEQG